MFSISLHKYVFTLDRDIVFQTDLDFGDKVTYFKDRTGKLRMSTFQNRIMVFKGYSWDGCTPKFKIGIGGRYFIIGTSDGDMYYHEKFEDYAPRRKYASLLHDIMLQFRVHLSVLGISTDDIHEEFKRELKEVNDSLRNLFRHAVIAYEKFIKNILRR